MKSSFYLFTGILVLSCVNAWAEDYFKIITFKTHSRMTFKIDEGVNVEWKANPKGFDLVLKGLNFADMGAPLGEEDKWLAQFEAKNDNRVGSIEMKEEMGGVRITGKWKFPQGKLTLARPTMEYFDFREKSPAQYVIDFWPKHGPTLIEVETARRKEQLAALLRKNQEDQKKRINRRLASEKRHQEAENSSRFCDQAIQPQTDVFLEFYPVHQSVDFSRWFSITNADQEFSYYEPKKKNTEAQYIRLALELYKQGNNGLAVRTVEFFISEFPHSEYQNEMQFLKANALIRLGLNPEGEEILKSLVIDAKDSPVALHSAIFLAATLMKQNSTLDALDRFLWLIQRYPDYHLNWVFHLGAAECLYTLKETDRAAKEYQWVIDHGPNLETKSEAALRMGDLYQSRFQYEQALGSYSQGLNYFGQYASKIPSIYVNLGESFYQIGEFKKAKTIFETFLKDYPNHPKGWRAAFRIGEIVGRTAESPKQLQESRDWLYKTINQYPTSPGATLARIRLLPCGDHGGFNLEAGETFFSQEGKNFDGNGEVVLTNYKDYLSLGHIRTLITLGSLETTAQAAIDELQGARSPFLRKILTTISNDFFRKMILKLLADGKAYEALTAYTKKAHLIPRPEDVSELDYILKLSAAASEMGLGTLAQQLAETYKKGVTSQVKSPGRVIASEDLVNQPKDLEAQLSASEHNMNAAKALWVSNRSTGTEPPVNQIRELLAQVREDSKHSYEKNIILALIDQKEGNLQSALENVSRAQLLSHHAKLDSWLASLEGQIGDPEVALNLYRNLEKKINLKTEDPKSLESNAIEDVLGLPPVPTSEELIVLEAEILEKQGKWGEAATTYARAVENGTKNSRILYDYVRTIQKSGNRALKAKAYETLEKLASDTSNSGSSDFWKKLAKEALEDEKSRQSINKSAKEGIK